MDEIQEHQTLAQREIDNALLINEKDTPSSNKKSSTTTEKKKKNESVSIIRLFLDFYCNSYIMHNRSHSTHFHFILW
jgi:hypothetical protein